MTHTTTIPKFMLLPQKSAQIDWIQSLDNSNNHKNQQSTSSYQTLNYEAPPFIPTSCIENQQQSFIAPSLSTFSNQTHHLPKLTLPNFSGNIIEWQYNLSGILSNQQYI